MKPSIIQVKSCRATHNKNVPCQSHIHRALGTDNARMLTNSVRDVEVIKVELRMLIVARKQTETNKIWRIIRLRIKKQRTWVETSCQKTFCKFLRSTEKTVRRKVSYKKHTRQESV